MAPCRREHRHRSLLGALEHGWQVADHAARAVGQGQLDREVQFLDDITEPAGDLKDDYLAFDMFSDPHLWACGRPGGEPRWELGRDLGGAPSPAG